MDNPHSAIRCFSSSTTTSSFEWAAEWIQTKGQDDGQLVVFLHGLLGNKRNVKSMAKAVCESLSVPGLLMDIRGHGDSQVPSHMASEPSTFHHLVSDLHLTLPNVVPDIHDRELIVMGHSMGGRVTMLHAATEGMKRPSHIWLLDTPPGVIGAGVHNVLKVAQEVATNESYTQMKRKDLTTFLMEEKKFDMGIAMWLSSAFDPKSPRKFQFDLKVANELVSDFESMNFLGLIEQAREEGKVGIHMIHGGANKAWEATGTLDLFRSWDNDPQKFSFHTLPKAGHWVHIDDPEGLLAAVESIHKQY